MIKKIASPCTTIRCSQKLEQSKSVRPAVIQISKTKIYKMSNYMKKYKVQTTTQIRKY